MARSRLSKRVWRQPQPVLRLSSLTLSCSSTEGLELLYQPEVVRLYLSLLTCSQNHNTLEAAAGALQNLAAGQWAVSECHQMLFTYIQPGFPNPRLMGNSVEQRKECLYQRCLQGCT